MRQQGNYYYYYLFI